MSNDIINSSTILIKSVDVFEGSAPEEWNAIISRLGGNMFHSTYWATYESRVQGGTPIFLLARDQNAEPCAASMAIFHQSNQPLLSLVTRQLELPAHPCVKANDESLADEFIRRCEEYARKRGCSRINIGSNMSAYTSFKPKKLKYSEHLRAEFLVDLTQETESLWQLIKKDQRERIKRTDKKGLVLSEGIHWDDLKGLKIVRESTQERRTSRNQGYDLRKEEEFYSRIYEDLIKPGAARLFIAKHNDDIVAAILFATFNRQAYSVFSGSTDFGYKAGAQSGLYWLAVNTFKKEGFQLLNRGGVPAAAEMEGHELHGIYRFKHRLGTTPYICRSGSKVLSPVRNGLCELKNKISAAVSGA